MSATKGVEVDLKGVIRSVKDFPKPGIMFRDITTLIADGAAMRYAVDKLAAEAKARKAEVILAAESRGYIFGAAVAYKLGLPLVIVRKPGKLPYKTIRHTYELEYGKDTLEIHRDAVEKGRRVLVVDDVLATGGTLVGACKLVEKLGGVVAGCACLVELSFLKGRARLKGRDLFCLVRY